MQKNKKNTTILDRLTQDFPSAYQVRLEVEKVRENSISTPLISTPLMPEE